MNPSAGAQNVGGLIAISATPDTNYVFNQWQSTGSIIITDTASASTTATVSGTGTITATFTYSPGTYQVTVTADPSVAIGGTFSVTYTKAEQFTQTRHTALHGLKMWMFLQQSPSVTQDP